MKRPLPTLRAIGLVCLGLVLIVGGRWLGRPEIAGLGTALFAVPVVAWIVARVRAPGAALSETSPRQSVTGTGELPVPGQELTVRLLDPGGAPRGGSVRPARSVRGDSASSYTWTPPTRGSYRLPPWIVTTFDALHLVRLRGELDPGDRIAVGAARREAAIPGQAELGLRQVRTGGDQLDTTTRPYRVGDPVRRVHWPVSARQGRLMVRPPLQESDGSRLVLVDRAQHHYSGAATQVARADGPAAASSTDFDAVISTAAFCLETLRSSPAVGSARLAYFPPVPASAGPPVSDEVSLACAAPEASVPRGTADAAATGATLTTGPDAAPAGGSGHTLLLTGLPGPEASAWPRGLHGSVTVLLHPAGHDQRPDADVTAAWERAGWSWHVLPPEGAS